MNEYTINEDGEIVRGPTKYHIELVVRLLNQYQKRLEHELNMRYAAEEIIKKNINTFC